MNNEQLRLEAVKRFTSNDDSITKELNDIVSLAAQICKTPVALVTLLDEEFQWFKAAVGTPVTCTTREASLCNYTIKQEEILIVPDTTLDERYCNNPLVANDPHVKFYAGIRLMTKDGFAVGSLCVIDFEVKALDDHQQHSLRVLSRQVINLMELHWSLESLERQHQKTQEQKLSIEASEIKLKAIFDSSKDTHILVGKNLEILAFNKSAAEFARATYQKKLQLRDDIMDYTDPSLSVKFKSNFKLALTGKSTKKEWMLTTNKGLPSWKETSFLPVKNNSGEIIGVAINSIDITTRKQHEEQINKQNEALTRIALVQSHDFRRPVACLLGIMDLMRMEKVDSDYFHMLDATVKELDERICSIVKDSEETIHGSMLATVA